MYVLVARRRRGRGRGGEESERERVRGVDGWVDGWKRQGNRAKKDNRVFLLFNWTRQFVPTDPLFFFPCAGG
jgi:hypothetical protein